MAFPAFWIVSPWALVGQSIVDWRYPLCSDLHFIHKITSGQFHLSAPNKHGIASYSSTAFEIVLHGACFGTGQPLFVTAFSSMHCNGIHSSNIEEFNVSSSPLESEPLDMLHTYWNLSGSRMKIQGETERNLLLLWISFFWGKHFGFIGMSTGKLDCERENSNAQQLGMSLFVLKLD